MEKIILTGGNKLNGNVEISAAKNSVLPIIAACILCADKCIIQNAPMLDDVMVICEVLSSIGGNICIDKVKHEITVDTSELKNMEPEEELVRKMRASFLMMGPMIARFGRVKISLPGGCNIGQRPIDLHLKGFSALGIDTILDHGYVEASGSKIVGNKIYLDFPSVGATENIMMASVYAEGETIIENAAAEPEIIDLANFLIKMGAKIFGAGTDTIKIIGVKNLHGTKYKPIYDRIEAGTFMAAAAITKSKIKIIGVNEEHVKPVIAKLNEMGVLMEKLNEEEIIVDGSKNLRPIDIKTLPYPGFPTDMQAQMMSLLCCIKGSSIITETIFENRFMHAAELKRMGANIKIDGRSAFIEGIDMLTGCEVRATDLRAGAAMILAGLVAEGTTTINDVYHIDRGYMNIEDKFRKLGANINRVNY